MSSMTSHICPHLTHLIARDGAQPNCISPLNRCAAGGTLVAIGGATQARVCLTPYHVACPYANDARLARTDLPRQALTPQAGPARPEASVEPLAWGHRVVFHLALIVGAAAGLIGLLAIILLLRARAPMVVVSRPTTQPPVAALATPLTLPSSPTAPPTPTSTATPTFTPIPTPTITPTPLRPPAVSPPTRLVIPALAVDIPVVKVGWQTVSEGENARLVWTVADYAASFHRTSAYPGRPGNTVISGHNNIRGEVFRDLESLATGDEVSVYVGETLYRYTVSEVHILPEKWASEEEKQENAKWIDYFPEERLTLVTCWPYEGNSHRVIVLAHPAPSK